MEARHIPGLGDFTIPCECGYEVIRLDLSFAEEDDPAWGDDIYMTILTPKGAAKWSLWTRLKNAVTIIKGDEYVFSEIIIKKENWPWPISTKSTSTE